MIFSKKREFVLDASRRMKRYVKRCPLEEPPTEAKIVSRFIRGLRSDLVAKDLYVKKCSTLNEVTKVAIDLVDNCKIFEEDATEIGSETGRAPRQVKLLLPSRKKGPKQLWITNN